MHVLMAAMTPALHAELRYAARVVRNAVTSRQPGAPSVLAAARRTLSQRRDDAVPTIRAAIDHYLHDETWRHGPRAAHDAAVQLAHVLGVPPPEHAPRRWHQPRLFDPAPPAPPD
jgi:hypothetical protein